MTIEHRLPSRIMATESISTQNDGFGEQLERLMAMLVEEIKAKDTKDVKIDEDHPVVVQIEKAIFERFKIKVDIITNEHLAAILPFYSNRNHIFIPEFFRGNLNIREQTKLLKAFDERKGTVNVEKATVGGIFSEYEHPLYLNFTKLVREYGFNASDIAACTLHEIGHGYYACYYADRTDRTNQVMASIARHLMTKETGDIEYIYKELSKVTPSVTKESVDKMLNGPRVVAGATWFKTVVGMVKSQMMDDTYNTTAFEQRADNFAARFGYGKQLVLALDKLSKGSPEKSYSLRVVVQLLTASTTIMLAALIFGLLATGGVAAAMIFVMYKFIFLTVFREDMADYTYDKLKMRYLRVRADAIDQLKLSTLKKEKIRELLDAIYALDSVIKETAVVKTLPAMIANFIFSGARQADKSITDQQLMESLASNDLFIHAAELRQA